MILWREILEFVWLVVNVDTDHFDSGRLVFCVDLFDVWQLVYTWSAPRSPNIEDNYFPLILLVLKRLAFQITKPLP